MLKMNILLCGGGTGGHYYPLMAIKEDLHSKSDFCFSFVFVFRFVFCFLFGKSCMLFEQIKPV